MHVAPGLGNALGMMHNARIGKTPLVVYAGQSPSNVLLQEPHLSGPLVDMARPIAKWAAQVEHAHDVLALDLDDRASLAREALRVDFVERRLRAEQLDRDELVQRFVPRGEDEPHPTFTDDPVDDVLPDARPHRTRRRAPTPAALTLELLAED